LRVRASDVITVQVHLRRAVGASSVAEASSYRLPEAAPPAAKFFRKLTRSRSISTFNDFAIFDIVS
jgi:hypothetical protein